MLIRYSAFLSHSFLLLKMIKPIEVIGVGRSPNPEDDATLITVVIPATGFSMSLCEKPFVYSITDLTMHLQADLGRGQ